MKEYPKILGTGESPVLGRDCYAFNKLDGSNLRFEYNSKQGWYKFGTRRHLFDRSCPEYGPAIELFLNKYASKIEAILQSKYKKNQGIMAYAEYFGPHSFAGTHDPVALGVPANPMDVVLFDINLHKKGFVPPQEFLQNFGHLEVPQLVYSGKVTEELIGNIRNGLFPVVEGVILKGGQGHDLWMRKVKTFAYLKKLKEVFGVGWKNHWE